MPEKYLTVREVAGVLRFHPKYVETLIRRGDIPAFRPAGRSLLVSEADLGKFMESRRVSALATETPATIPPANPATTAPAPANSPEPNDGEVATK